MTKEDSWPPPPPDQWDPEKTALLQRLFSTAWNRPNQQQEEGEEERPKSAGE